jgi:hypothetical protein
MCDCLPWPFLATRAITHPFSPKYKCIYTDVKVLGHYVASQPREAADQLVEGLAGALGQGAGLEQRHVASLHMSLGGESLGSSHCRQAEAPGEWFKQDKSRWADVDPQSVCLGASETAIQPLSNCGSNARMLACERR